MDMLINLIVMIISQLHVCQNIFSLYIYIYNIYQFYLNKSGKYKIQLTKIIINVLDIYLSIWIIIYNVNGVAASFYLELIK